jgi:hypothetical protein
MLPPHWRQGIKSRYHTIIHDAQLNDLPIGNLLQKFPFMDDQRVEAFRLIVDDPPEYNGAILIAQARMFFENLSDPPQLNHHSSLSGNLLRFVAGCQFDYAASLAGAAFSPCLRASPSA